AMTKPPLATTISSLLVSSMLITPAVSFAAGGYRGSVESVAEREKARRADYETRGRNAIDSGNAAMKDKDYEKATAYFKNACDIIPNAPNSQSLYNTALHGFCEASTRLAEQRITEGRYADAENTLRVVLDERYDPQCKRAIIILSRLEQPDYYNKTIGPKFRANIEQVKQWFIEAQGLYDTGRFLVAKKRCEQILNVDPTNIAARRFEEKIDRALSDYGVAGYNETRADAIAKTDMAWARPIRRFNTQSEIVVENTSPQASTERIRRKLERIVIPKLEFREATIREAIDFLKKKSVELDDFSPAGEKGVNIVLKLEGGGGGNAGGAGGGAAAGGAAIPGIPGLDAPAAAPAGAPVAAAPIGNPADARITVSLTNIPLVEALKYVTGLANLKYKVEPYAVSVVPITENTDVLITKEWKIQPDLIPRTPGAGGAAANALTAPVAGAGGGASDASKGGSGIADRESAKNWLIANGVAFNGNASAIYIIRSSRLIVRNTQDQLDLVDTIISSPQTGGPVQVEIESKFVEIQQNNLKELSFDWLVGQFNAPATKNVFLGGGTFGTSPAGNTGDFPFLGPDGVPVGTNPLTAGNRSGNLAISSNAIDALLFPVSGATSLAPAIGAISGVFTDPQFQLVIRALNQKKGVDLLSSPKVTTKSGQRAVIEIIREFRYPTEFTPPQIPQTFQSPAVLTTGAVGVSSSGSFPVTPTTPTAFETRNTGVTLEVEPVVGPDGYTIDLNLVPQVVEFEGFINYGSPITSTTTNPLTGASQQNVITPNVINQPIFSTRKVTTSVSVYDGSTVVLGGLIREDVQKVEDKVPIIGDIPIIGRLFRSSVDQHIKRNLVIFVSARLINAAGEPVRADDEKEEIIETIAPPEIAPLQELPLMSK
ncbi:MAG: Amuc_1098 family type IV pilus outer membrane protein, partial [Chthoniobacter sp.]|uniref:Amuc_1098 family type IV pilus outer membrane protein n=1 Tax=Chthoniobacter sp. TaxID=2510640 RepID=UPI0032A985B4